MKEAEKHIPNYRIPTEIMGSRTASRFAQEPAAINFARYHYGMWKSFMHIATDLVKGNAHEKKEALGNVAAESHTARIRGLSDRIHEAEATCALLKLAAGAPGQLQAWSDVTAPFARAAREDFRAVRSMLESACAEESKQRAEIMLNANVLAMCVEQARRLKDAAASVAEEDYRRLADAAAAARARFGAACAESLAAATDDLRAEEANLAVAAAELAERRLAREEDQRRALEQRSRLADEFATLKGTVDRFRESESEQCLALAAEVAALERDAQARLANEALALQTEVAAIRAVSAVEAERIGSQMLVRFREETEVAVESIRASATQRFQLVVDEVAALKACFFSLAAEGVSLLDLVSYTGYKYVGLTINTVVGLFLGSSAYYLSLIYT
jgi:hypothetical protein